ncbi:MAG: N-acetyltransferase [Xanthomonadales bacterium]|nr:N-acetyltransferase [Xanthomonadales bacterium]
MLESLEIRECGKSDLKAVGSLHLEAFGHGEGTEVAALVDDLLNDPTSHPILSLCAQHHGETIGHVLYSSVVVEGNHPGTPARILAPLGVIPHAQGQGVGGRLIHVGLDRLRGEGVGLVFVLGHPAYYSRSGFEPAGLLGLDAPYTLPREAQGAWMVRELNPGYLGKVRGRVRCGDALMHPRHWRE